MGDWFIATEGVKIVKDSPGLLPQIITGVSTIICSCSGSQSKPLRLAISANFGSH